MGTADTFRAFYAVPLDPASARGLAEAARAAVAAPGEAGWRVVPAERIHLTLKFLGDTPLRLVPDLGAALRGAAAAVAPFPLSFGGWHRLPGPRDPRVLAAGVSDPTGSLPRLASLLEERAAALGFPRESRPFLSHATVARRRPAGRRSGGRGGVHPPASGMGATVMPVVPDMVVRRVVLMKSTLGPDGPAYEVVEEAAPGAGPSR